MGNWRWPSWAMVGLTALYLLYFVYLLGVFPADESGEAGYQWGLLLWPYVIGMVCLGVAWRRTRPKPCPSCGQRAPSGAAACPRCGASVAAATIGACPQCGQLVYQSSPSCPRCGYVPGQLVSPQPPPPPPRAAPQSRE